MNKPGGKGDRNRSDSKAYRDNFDKIEWDMGKDDHTVESTWKSLGDSIWDLIEVAVKENNATTKGR